MTATLSPVSKQVTVNGNTYNLVAFYYPGKETEWDKVFQAGFLANFYPCSLTMSIKDTSTGNLVTGTFQTAEAGFQATKWWFDSAVLKQFENAKTGDDAYQISKRNRGTADYSYAGLGRDVAMKEVLTQKFNDADFKTALLQTKDAYLLEHRKKNAKDDYWSDNYIGTGPTTVNNLGKTIMEIRETYGGSPSPNGDFEIADFSTIVINDYS